MPYDKEQDRDEQRVVGAHSTMTLKGEAEGGCGGVPSSEVEEKKRWGAGYTLRR